VDARFEAIERTTALERESAKLASRLAYDNMDRRLDSMNEFRGQMDDQAKRFMPRTECTAALDRLEEDVRSLRESRAELQGKASQSSVMVSWLIAGVGLLLSIVSLFVTLSRAG
jgi:hypothetical protein